MMAAEMKALQDQHQREMEDCEKETQRKREGNLQHFFGTLINRNKTDEMLLNILQLYTFKNKTFPFCFQSGC